MLGGSGDEVSVMSVVCTRGTFSVSYLGYFSSVGSSYKPSYPFLTLFFVVHHIQEHFKKKRGRKKKIQQHKGGEGQA